MSVPKKKKSNSSTRRGRSHQSLGKKRSSVVSRAYNRSRKSKPKADSK